MPKIISAARLIIKPIILNWLTLIKNYPQKNMVMQVNSTRMVGIIEDYKKTKSPSECMLEMWNEFKEDYIQEAAHIKMMQDIYKMTK